MINVNFSGYANYQTDTLTQWDLNQELKVTGLTLSGTPTVLFFNKKSITADPVTASYSGGVLTCEIPNSMLTECYPIYAYIRVKKGSTYSVVAKVRIPVESATVPADYVYIENIEIITYSDVMAKLNEIENNEVRVQVLQETIETYIDKAIADGSIDALFIQDGSITQDKLSPDINFGVQDGSITAQKTTFFEKKQIGDAEEIYKPIAENNTLANEKYSKTTGYYINMCSTQYSALRMTQDDSKVSFFRKVTAGEKVVLRGKELQLEHCCFIDDSVYNVIMSGYNGDISASVNWTNIVDAVITKTTLGQIREDLTPELYKVWPEKVGYYAYEQAFNEAPFDGYLFLGKSLCDFNSILTYPNYDYSVEIRYGYTLEKTLKNDPFIGEKLSTLLEFDFKDYFPRQSKFNFTPLTDAISANTNATATLEKLSDPLGDLQYVGGICANKKIYMAPNTASKIMVYDTVHDYYYFIGSGLGDQAFKYTGWVAYGGYLYSIPRGVNNLLRVNPVTDEVTVIDIDTNYPIAPYGDYRDSHHYNGVISDNGYMYCPPAYSSDKLLKINMNNFKVEELDFTSADVSTWIGCVKHPTEDKIIFLSTNVFRVWNCEDDTYTDIVSETTRACYDMVYDPRYNCFIGIYPNHIFALKLSDYTIIDSDHINYMSTGYGVTLGLDGAIYHLEGASAYKFTFDGSTFSQGSSITTSENVGSSNPCLAGQAIDNEGNIYGIPGSGALVRLKFLGLTRRVPDYIVSSPYYGKY